MVPLHPWPLQFPNNRVLMQIRYVASRLLMCYFVLFVLTQYINIALSLHDDFLEVVTNLTVSLLYTEALYKAYIVSGHGFARILQQIRTVEKSILEGDDEEMKAIYSRNVRYNAKVWNGFIILGIITTIPFFTNPMIMMFTMETHGNVTAELPLPFSSWFPFDKNYYYGCAYGIQLIAAVIGAFLIINTDILLWALEIFAVGQLKILQYKFQNLSQHSHSLVGQGLMTMDQARKHCVKKCIHMHYFIISYTTDIDKMIRWLMLMSFLICSLQGSCLGFKIIVSGLGLEQIAALEYLMAMMVQMLLFYWHANEISVESMNVAMAIWNGDFYEYPDHIQKSLQLIMFRAQIPLTLNVGPFYAMSTQTVLTIIRAGYSYVTLLRQLYN